MKDAITVEENRSPQYGDELLVDVPQRKLLLC
jgi:hypothetical protein